MGGSNDETDWAERVLAWARSEVGWDQVEDCTWEPVLWCQTCQADLRPAQVRQVRQGQRDGRVRCVCVCCGGRVKPMPF